MTEYRKPTPAEIEALTAAGNSAENWDAIEVAQNFTPAQLSGCRLEGRVQIGRGARLRRCTIRNYRIGEEALIEGVTALECRRESSFGNGVRVAAINENGGRTVRIYDRLTAQTAYILAVYRYRPEAVEAIERMIERYAAERRDPLGTVGPHARITGARFIREVNIGKGATIDGASLLENGTVCAGAYVGIDVQARDFIAAEGARIDGGTLLERCFAGECCTLDKHFTAVDSLFFANSHCENGEAVSIFAGPYTVSHHKSSLLIAGMFSFFNAGSGANQSNHLFKSGAVHQSVHLRGCKFGSGTYIMAPAIEGPFTLVLGRHTQHHDTSAFPFSYLVEQDGRSALMPGANLTSYGTVRDIGKWPERDRRTVKRDRINFEEDNPYLAGGMIDAVNLGALSLEKLEAMTCVCSVGLDMIAIPGNVDPTTISAIIADEMAIGMVNTKTTAVRVIPAIGMKEGDMLEYEENAASRLELFEHLTRNWQGILSIAALCTVFSVIAIGMQIAVRGFAWMIGICIALAAVCLLVFVIYLNMYWRTRLRILDIRSAQNEQKADAENASDL